MKGMTVHLNSPCHKCRIVNVLLIHFNLPVSRIQVQGTEVCGAVQRIQGVINPQQRVSVAQLL